MKYLLLFLCLAAAPMLHAQSQHEMNREAREDFAKADAELNKIYKKLLTEFDDTAREKFKATQRAWVVLRDAEAAFEADAEARGGSMEPMIYSGTQARLTRERVAYLKKLLDQ